jgi:hypothetical protein
MKDSLVNPLKTVIPQNYNNKNIMFKSRARLDGNIEQKNFLLCMLSFFISPHSPTGAISTSIKNYEDGDVKWIWKEERRRKEGSKVEQYLLLERV